jgi:hypothetical protein
MNVQSVKRIRDGGRGLAAGAWLPPISKREKKKNYVCGKNISKKKYKIKNKNLT